MAPQTPTPLYPIGQQRWFWIPGMGVVQLHHAKKNMFRSCRAEMYPAAGTPWVHHAPKPPPEPPRDHARRQPPPLVEHPPPQGTRHIGTHIPTTPTHPTRPTCHQQQAACRSGRDQVRWWGLAGCRRSAFSERQLSAVGLGVSFVRGIAPTDASKVRLTELKYVVLSPVYQNFREPGWSLRVMQASHKQASN